MSATVDNVSNRDHVCAGDQVSTGDQVTTGDQVSTGQADDAGDGLLRAGSDGPAMSATHLVIIPSFNSGTLLASTVAEARTHWAPVWVVIDGSTDGSAATVEAMARTDPGLRVLRLPANRGKGAAVRHGLTAAEASGFTHALVMDSDGQHPGDRIPAFMAASAASPDALVMGRPVFGTDAPWVRVAARRLCNFFASIETLGPVGDTLFGFRVYPVAALLWVMQRSAGMRRFDFDPEAVVRLVWYGLELVHLPAPVRYLRRDQGGVSHFKYLRDNVLLVGMHVRLMMRAMTRLIAVICRRPAWAAKAPGASDGSPTCLR